MIYQKIALGLGIMGLVVGATAVGLHLLDRPPKIAYAETSALMSQFNVAIKARKQFEDLSRDWDKNIQILNDSLNSAMERLKQEYEKATPGKKDELRAMLQKRNDDLQKYSNAVKKMSEAKEKELMGPVISQMNGFMKTWGRQHGYAFIFGTTSGGNILQADADLDVTAQLLKDMNEYYRDLPVTDTVKAATIESSQANEGKKGH